MKNQAVFYFIIIASAFITTACSSFKKKQAPALYTYKADSQQLHDQVLQLDSIFFDAYNTCDLDKQASIYSDSLEFYHDQSGLSTSKKEILEATKKNICGKVTRTLLKESVEVYPIKGFGAIEIGLHKFHNNTQQDGKPSEPGKFIIIWKQTGNDWKITRVVSLH